MEKLDHSPFVIEGEVVEPGFIWCSSSRRGGKLDHSTFLIGGDAVEPRNEVCDIGLILDGDLPMTSHVTGRGRTSNPKTAEVCFSVSDTGCHHATRHLVLSLILSRIDYSNVAFAGLPKHSLVRFQAVINTAARLQAFSFANTRWTKNGPCYIKYAGHRRATRGRSHEVLRTAYFVVVYTCIGALYGNNLRNL